MVMFLRNLLPFVVTILRATQTTQTMKGVIDRRSRSRRKPTRDKDLRTRTQIAAMKIDQRNLERINQDWINPTKEDLEVGDHQMMILVIVASQEDHPGDQATEEPQGGIKTQSTTLFMRQRKLNLI